MCFSVFLLFSGPPPKKKSPGPFFWPRFFYGGGSLVPVNGRGVNPPQTPKETRRWGSEEKKRGGGVSFFFGGGSLCPLLYNRPAEQKNWKQRKMVQDPMVFVSFVFVVHFWPFSSSPPFSEKLAKLRPSLWVQTLLLWVHDPCANSSKA